MALINCPNCGEQVTDKAKKCIHCGCKINISLGKRIQKRIIYICALIGIFIVLGSIIFNNIKMKEYYNQALNLYQKDKLTEAKKILKNIPNYKGVNELKLKISKKENELINKKNIKNYYLAIDLFESGDFVGARDTLDKIPKKIEIENETIYIKEVLEEIEMYEKVVAGLINFSENLKDPDSIKIAEVYYSPTSDEVEKDVILVTYRATNSFGAYVEGKACIQDGKYMGEEYADIELEQGMMAYKERQELNKTIVQNGLVVY